ncbi:MAG: inositol monophosphatase family protein [Fimbriimonadaceae bacterium]
MSPRLQFAMDIALEAGNSTLAYFQSDLEVSFKADDSPVTLADRNAESILRKRISQRFPEDGIYGEEEGQSGDQTRRWVLDPIDGTKSFICGVPLFATLVAFEDDSHRQIGVAFFPALDLMVSAEIGGGARCNGELIHVSRKAEISTSVICTGSVSTFRKRSKLDGYLKLSDEALASRTWCDAYGHCLVAMGRVEAMIDPRVEPYDIAAVQVIVTEAGGKVTTFDGGNDPQTDAISSNGLLHDLILERMS